MIKPTFLSWILVTVVFIVAMYFDGFHFSFGNILVSIGFFAFIGFIVAVYFLIFGGIALLLISGLSRVNKSTYLLAAFASSLPMLFFCILSREPEWIIATLVAGVGAGVIYAGLAPTS